MSSMIPAGQSPFDSAPRIRQIKSGWLAIGNRWAVRGDTADDATRHYQERLAFYMALDAEIAAKGEQRT